MPYDPDSDEYARTVSKLDGTFNGPDLSVDYSNLTGGGGGSSEPADEPSGSEGGE